MVESGRQFKIRELQGSWFWLETQVSITVRMCKEIQEVRYQNSKCGRKWQKVAGWESAGGRSLNIYII